MNEKIQKYIDEHTFCSEYLFKDWESFLDLLYTEYGCISSILWWDHCRKSQLRESVADNPEEYCPESVRLMEVKNGQNTCRLRK